MPMIAAAATAERTKCHVSLALSALKRLNRRATSNQRCVLNRARQMRTQTSRLP